MTDNTINNKAKEGISDTTEIKEDEVLHDNDLDADTIDFDEDSTDEVFGEFSDEFDPEDPFEDYDNAHNTDEQSSSTSSLNWFNIGIISAAIVVIAGGANVFMPGLFGGGNISTPQSQPSNPMLVTDQASQEDAAMSAASNGNGQSNNNLDNILFDPDQLAQIDNTDDAEATNAAQQLNPDEIFGNLDVETPVEEMSDEEIDNLFADINTINVPVPDTSGNFNNTNQAVPSEIINTNNDVSNTLPLPSDADLGNLYEDIIIAEERPEPAVQTQPIPQTAQMQTDANNSQDETINALNARIASLTNRLEDMAARQEQTAAVQSSQPQNQSENTVDLSRIEATLNRLDSRIDQIATAQERLEKAVNERPIVTASAPTPARATTPVRETTQATKPQIIMEPAPRRAVAPKPSVTWELRGASPNSAFLAEKGTQNLRTVSVGDTLEGLGRVTSIGVENNAWVVRGTNGIVTQ
jgi:hypothetical protein